MGQHQTAIGLESIKNLNWKDKKVLDIGCGNGRLSLEVLNRTGARQLIGIDLDEKAIAKAKLINDKRLSFFVSDASNLSFENESFDIIFCNIAFQQFLDKEKAIHEMNRVLRNGGEVIINFIEEKSEVVKEIVRIMKDSFDIELNKKGSKISRQEFEDIAKLSGFKIIKSESLLDTFYFDNSDVFFDGYISTIEAKTKRLSPAQKEVFMENFKDSFNSKKTKQGIPDVWRIVSAHLLK